MTMGSNSNIDIIQCNLDRSKSCLQEFTRFFMASKHSFALITEPYIGSGIEVKPIHGLQIFQFPGPNKNKVKSCIFSKSDSPVAIGLSQFSSANLCIVQLSAGSRRVYLASVYIEPGEDILGTLAGVESFMGRIGSASCVVGGDFNGWHPLWGSRCANDRGKAVVEMAYGRDLYVCNVGHVPTFETVTHGRARSSIVDITLATADIADWVVSWRVNLEGCPSSQHNAVDFSLVLDLEMDRPTDGTSTFKHKSEKAQWAEFKASLHTRISLADKLEQQIHNMNTEQLDTFIEHLTDTIHKACRDSMPVKKPGGRHKPPWWTDALESRRRDVIDRHRKLHTAVKHNSRANTHTQDTDSTQRHDTPPQDTIINTLAAELATLKSTYAAELREASSANFREFCNLQSKENVWSLTNRLLKDANPRKAPITLHGRDRHTNDGEETARALLDHFFPDDDHAQDTHPRHRELRHRAGVLPEADDDLPFTENEVLELLGLMSHKKAPGLDHLTSDICYQFAAAYPRLVTDVMNRCLELRHFPARWKTAYIKIIPKPGKTDYSELDAHRPIGLIPVFGKLLEKLFIKRVTYALDRRGENHPSQFGFKEQKNTVMAIDEALSRVRHAKADGNLVVAVSLDIKSAFNNAWWPALLERLRAARCPANIFELITDYLTDRTVVLDYAGARVSKRTTKGCVQGSACGPVLWNLILDELLGMRLPEGCHIQAYADDVLLISQAKTLHTLQENTNAALRTIAEWGESVKLCFGADKTQLMAFSLKAKAGAFSMEGRILPFVSELKYLGVVIDHKLLFNKHVEHVITKAERIFGKLCLFCRPTWGTHPENVQTIYRQVIEPIITYAAGIWGHAACKAGIKRKLLSLQRGFAIKAIKGFHTISTVAAIALAEFIPLDLKVREVHEIESTKLTHTTRHLPGDIRLERPTPPHELLHPASRLTLSHDLPTYTELENLHSTPHNVIIYTDGSKQEDGATGAAFVCYEGNDVATTKKFKLHDGCSVFQAELYAIHRACLWAIGRAHDEGEHHNYTILSDSRAALAALRDRSNTHPLVTAIHKTVHAHVGRFCFAWVKAHVGIPGNEAADTAAKDGTALHRRPDYSAFPISFVKHKARSETRRIWRARYASATQGAHTRTILPDLRDIETLYKHTKISFYLTQMLTGHGYHKQYLKRFKIVDSDACPCDEATAQTIEHLLKECPQFSRRRYEHETHCELLQRSPLWETQLCRILLGLHSTYF